MMDSRFYTFVGGDTGQWSIVSIQTVIGQSLEIAPCLDIQNANLQEHPSGARWLLRGVTSFIHTLPWTEVWAGG